MSLRHRFTRFETASPLLVAIGRLLTATHKETAQQAFAKLGHEFIGKITRLGYESPKAAVYSGKKNSATFKFAEAKSSPEALRWEKSVIEASLRRVAAVYAAKNTTAKGGFVKSTEIYQTSEGFSKEELSEMYSKLQGILDDYQQSTRAKVAASPVLSSSPSDVSRSPSDTSGSEVSQPGNSPLDISPSAVLDTIPEEPGFRAPSPIRVF